MPILCWRSFSIKVYGFQESGRTDEDCQNKKAMHKLRHPSIKDCPSHRRCFRCQQMHHTILHSEKGSNQSKTTTSHTGCLLSVASSKALANKDSPASDHETLPFVFLKTAIATVSSHAASSSANLLIEEGSQLTFITEKQAKKLRLRSTQQVPLILSCFKGLSTSSTEPSYYDIVYFLLHGVNGERITIPAVVLNALVEPLEDPHRAVLTTLPHLQHLQLAHTASTDDRFPVDILIGADSYWTNVGDTNIHGKGPTAVNSFIGYLVSGPLLDTVTTSQSSSYHISAVQCDDINRLWSLEAIGIHPDNENADSMASYQAESVSFENNQYTARLPWEKEHSDLPSNYSICQRRTRHTVKSLLKKPQLLQPYGKIIRDQLAAGFIEKVPRSREIPKGHYISHFAVHKNSATTPIYIVYDCSCKTRSGSSLNDCLLIGPPLQNDMIQILFRFRIHHIGFSSDIEKAFHKVQLHKDDRDFLRFLWLSDNDDPDSNFDIYRFKVVPFDASSSPFILNSVIKKHLHDDSSPISGDMESNIYVDNLISGSETTAEALQYYSESLSIFQEESFSLQTWAPSDLSLTNQATLHNVADSSPLIKVLGLLWTLQTDTLQLPVVDLTSFCSSSATKRDVLRGIASIYDPLGFITPLSVPARILICNRLGACLKGLFY